MESIDFSTLQIIRADVSDRAFIRSFVTTLHVDLSGYNEIVKMHQIKELETDFPEFYNEDEWNLSICWKLVANSKGSDTTVFLGTIGLRHFCVDIVEISYFFMEPKAQGRGLGQMLLTHCINKVKDEKVYRSIRLLTLQEVYGIAYSIYLKYNFVLFDEVLSKDNYFTLLFLSLDLHA